MSQGGDTVWSLVEALRPLAILDNLRDRNMVVKMVSDWLGYPLSVEENPKLELHLFNLVEACQRRSNGLQALVEVLGHIDQGSIPMTRARRLIEDLMVAPIWPDEQREELFTLLPGLLPDCLRLYREIAGTAGPELPGAASPLEMFQALETVNADPDGMPKPLVFVERLAELMPADVAIELRVWVDRQADMIGLRDELKTRRAAALPAGAKRGLPAEPAPRTPAYLVIQLQREGVGDQYRLCSWRQLDVSEGWHPERDDDYIGDLAQVRRRVATLTEAVEADWAQYQAEITVEFVLPDELLNLDVDQWPWEIDDPNDVPVGCHFWVVIRNLERMRKRKWHLSWRSRWWELQSQLSRDGAISVDSGYWSAPGRPRKPREVAAALEGARKLVVLVPSTPPGLDTVGSHEVAIGVRSGMPVMVWHREDCASPDFVAAVHDMLHGDNPRHVLERARLIRVNALSSGSGHLGNHLALLWDDPERVVTPDRPTPPEQVSV